MASSKMILFENISVLDLKLRSGLINPFGKSLQILLYFSKSEWICYDSFLADVYKYYPEMQEY